MADNPNLEYNPRLGIDLGTTFSSIARFDGRGPVIYNTPEGDAIPSAVYVKNGETLVGSLALSRGRLSPSNLAILFKREMGNHGKVYNLEGTDYTPVQLSALVLKKLHEHVKAMYPQGSFQDRGVVVTMPYYFKANEIEATRQAVQQAGLDLIELVPEPVAASLMYAWDVAQQYPNEHRQENILVFDLGGGTFDVTVFEMVLTPPKQGARGGLSFRVKSTNGDAHLGGMDFDQRLRALALQKSGLSLDDLPPAVRAMSENRLLEAVIEAKKALGQATSWCLAVPNITPTAHLSVDITREEFEECISDYMEKIRNLLHDVFTGAGTSPSSLDRVVLVGGSSRLPCVKRLIDEVAPNRTYQNRNPDLAVSLGAALFAAFLDDPELLDREIDYVTVNNHDLGVEIHTGAFLKIIKKDRPTPCEDAYKFTLSKDDLTSFVVKVYQGSDPIAKNNTEVGSVLIDGLPKMKKGDLSIRVTFRVGMDQSLNVVVDVVETRLANQKDAPYKRWNAKMNFR